MTDARPATASEADEEQELAADALDVDTLKTRADVEGLITLARAARAGSIPGGRDMQRCYAAYLAAAELGSADADYAVALFHATGSVVAQDLKAATTYLRRAAEKGSVPAKVYLGNLYELGIHYKVDPEKADVWYRNAARGARIDASPGSDEHTRALAELGCVRYVNERVEADIPETERARLQQRARAHGAGLRIKTDLPATSATPDPTPDPAPDRLTLVDSLGVAERSADEAKASASMPAAPKPGAEARPKPAPPPRPKAATTPSVVPYALGAFGYALLFALTGVGAAYAASLGAAELAAHGTPLPGLGHRTELVFPIVLGVVGILPTWLVYRFRAVLKALVMGAAFAAIGWVAWGAGQAVLHPDRLLQALGFGLPGFLAALCVFGFLGETKKQPARGRR